MRMQFNVNRFYCKMHFALRGIEPQIVYLDFSKIGAYGDPKQIRTAVYAVKGRCPKPSRRWDHVGGLFAARENRFTLNPSDLFVARENRSLITLLIVLGCFSNSI